MEFHWTGYQFMGPGTHLKKRLARGGSRHQSIGQDYQDPRHRLQSIKESQRQVGCG